MSQATAGTSGPPIGDVVWPAGTPCKPQFMIIGAPKCGTTSLYTYIASHPEVQRPALKELIDCDLQNLKILAELLYRLDSSPDSSLSTSPSASVDLRGNQPLS